MFPPSQDNYFSGIHGGFIYSSIAGLDQEPHRRSHLQIYSSIFLASSDSKHCTNVLGTFFQMPLWITQMSFCKKTSVSLKA